MKMNEYGVEHAMLTALGCVRNSPPCDSHPCVTGVEVRSKRIKHTAVQRGTASAEVQQQARMPQNRPPNPKLRAQSCYKPMLKTAWRVLKASCSSSPGPLFSLSPMCWVGWGVNSDNRATEKQSNNAKPTSRNKT